MDKDTVTEYMPDHETPFTVSRKLTIEELRIVLEYEQEEPVVVMPNGEIRTKDGETLRRLKAEYAVRENKKNKNLCPTCKGTGANPHPTG